MAERIQIIIDAKDKASGAINGVNKSLGQLGTVALGIGAAAGAAVAGVGVAAWGMAADMQGATADIQAQFGMTGSAAEHFAGLARDAWVNNWGESIGDVAGVMGQVNQQLSEFGVTSDEAITGATTAALALRDTFQVDTAESIETARALMGRFGLTSEQSFDLITEGLQSGLNRSGDFLESITEYAPVFEAAGFSADQMYNIMESGAAEGVLGTDKIADAVKEMTVRLSEGGDDVGQAFQAIGMDFDRISGFVQSGDENWADYFDNIVTGLNSIEDPIKRQQAQVAIFGTMAEDLGANFTEGLSAAGMSLEEFAGATDSLDKKYTSFGQVFEAFKRQALGAIAPLSDMMLGLAQQIMPHIQEAFEVVAPIVERFAGAIGDFIAEIVSGEGPMAALMGFLREMGVAEDVRVQIYELATGILEIKDRVVEFLAPIADAIGNFVEWQDVLIALAVVLGGVVISAIASVVAAVGPLLLVAGALIAAIALVRNAWENNWLGIRDKVKAVIDFLVPFVQNAIAAIKEWWAQNGEAILSKAQEIWGAIQSAISAIMGAIQSVITTVANAIKTFWSTYHDELLSLATGVWEAIKTLVSGVFDAIVSIFEAFADLFRGDWEGFLDDVLSIWEGIWDTVVSVIGTLWDSIGPLLSALWSDIKAWFASVDWASLGRNIITGLVNGINAAAGAVVNTLSDIVNNAINSIKDLLGISSPSRIFAEIGGQMAAGLEVGIRGGAPVVIGAAAGMARAAVSTTTSTVNNYNLSINSSASAENITREYRMMEAWNGGV